MWNYKNQIKIRWISFITGLIILAILLFIYKEETNLSQAGTKIVLTKLQVDFESLPIRGYAIIVFGSICLMLCGVPSVSIVIPLTLMKGCTFAFIVAASCQAVATLIAMRIAYKAEIEEIPENLKHKLEVNQATFQTFAFWSRLYYSIPLRTIDKLTPFVHKDEEGYYTSIIAAASAMMIRICIPTLLCKHLLEQFTYLAPNPEGEKMKLLVWGSLLLVYTILPKIPELMICPSKVKNVIIEIEHPSLPSSKDKLREEVEKAELEAHKQEASRFENNNL